MIANRYRVAAAGVAITFLLSACGHDTRTRYADDLVDITDHSAINYFNVHWSKDTAVLTIWGREFKDVRGREPCYLKIPGRQMILFVTGRNFDGGQAVVHLADISTRKIIDIPAYDSGIGSSIGEPKEGWFERISKVDGDQIVVEAACIGRHYEYFITLSPPRFLREEGDVEGPPDGKLHHHIYEDGKIPR